MPDVIISSKVSTVNRFEDVGGVIQNIEEEPQADGAVDKNTSSKSLKSTYFPLCNFVSIVLKSIGFFTISFYNI